jgi:hypothetical protein
MEAQIGERPARAAKFSGCPLWDEEKVALRQQILLPVDLQKPLTFQDHTGDIHLGIDVQGHTLPYVKPEKVTVQIRTFERERRALDLSDFHFKQIDDLGFRMSRLREMDDAIANRATGSAREPAR